MRLPSRPGASGVVATVLGAVVGVLLLVIVLSQLTQVGTQVIPAAAGPYNATASDVFSRLASTAFSASSLMMVLPVLAVVGAILAYLGVGRR